MELHEDLEWQEDLTPPSSTPANYKRTNEDDTSITWNYQDRTVEVFTNRRRVYEQCIESNPGYLKAMEDDVYRVYILEYPFEEIRRPDLILIKRRKAASRGLNEPVGITN